MFLRKIYIIIIIAQIMLNFVLSQNCETGFTNLIDIPNNITNINNDDYCFNDGDLAVLDSIYIINELNATYESFLHLGLQTWVTGRLTNWVATYVPSGQNGLTQRINQLPNNLGNLTNLAGLYIEKHNLSSLPPSFSNMSSLFNLAISNNWLVTLPEDFGNLINLQTLDLGYNQLEFIPESIGDLINLQYLFLFNNQLTSIPETICNLNLDWDGISPANYPYFASGGNLLCNCDLIPECVENSDNVNISMEQNYYSFLLDEPQNCLDSPYDCILDNSCPDLGDINGDGENNILDIVTISNCILASNCSSQQNACAADLNLDQEYNILDIVILANCILASNCSI